MKPVLDPINTAHVWNIGALVGVLSVVGVVLSNASAVSALLTIISNAPVPVKIGAAGVLAGIVAMAIGKPPATSPATKG